MFFFQAEDGIRGAEESRGLGDGYKGQVAWGFWVVRIWGVVGYLVRGVLGVVRL